MFISDHGEELFDHGGWQHNPNMYQEVVHVPLIVKPPASTGIETEVRVQGLAMQVDLRPTVVDLSGFEDEAELIGTSWIGRTLPPMDETPSSAFSEVQYLGMIRRGVFDGADRTGSRGHARAGIRWRRLRRAGRPRASTGPTWESGR